MASLAVRTQFGKVVGTVTACRFSPGLMMKDAPEQAEVKVTSGGKRRLVSTTT